MTDPFFIKGPALIQYSGGRSSAYMLWRILQAHDGELPADVRVTFANTGKEFPATLDFVRDCGERWSVPIVWLEYVAAEEPGERFRIVDWQSASRQGEPFKALIEQRGYLPNPVTRNCTNELKINAIQRWAKTVGLGEADRVIGFRADERHRLASIREREAGGNGRLTQAPMVAAGITKADVTAFWARANFDLGLPRINDRTPHGNCDLCYLKSASTIMAIMRERPELARWWIEAETLGVTNKPLGALFRVDRPSYAAMFDAVQRQREFDFGDRDEIVDCFCGDGT